MDDIITLVGVNGYTYDKFGNEGESESFRNVFCKVESVGRTEFYQAAQNDMHPQYIFTISHYKDYRGEKELLYTDWTGERKRYSIIRTYRVGDSIEITAEERIEDYTEDSNGSKA